MTTDEAQTSDRAGQGFGSSLRSTSSIGALGIVVSIVVVAALAPWLIEVGGFRSVTLATTTVLIVNTIIRSTFPTNRPVLLAASSFYFSWLVVAPTYQLAFGVAAWRDERILNDPAVDKALLLNLVVCAMFFVSVYVKPVHESSPVQKSVGSHDVFSRTVPISCLVICAAVTPYAVRVNGGFASFFSTREQQISQLAANGVTLAEAGGIKVALASILPNALVTASSVLMLARIINHFSINRDESRKSRFLSLNAVDGGLFAASFAGMILYSNPFSNSRSAFFAAFGAMVFMCLRPITPRRSAVMAGTLLFLTLVVYPVGNILRGSLGGYTTGLAAFGGPDFDGFQQMVNAINFAEANGHTFGRYLLAAMFFFIPRSVWTSKSEPASADVGEYRGYEYLNLSLPLPAELWLEFGFVGLILLFALMVGAARFAVTNRSFAGSRSAILVPYLALASLMTLRGSLGSTGPIWLTTMGLLWLGTSRFRKTRRPAVGQSRPLTR